MKLSYKSAGVDIFRADRIKQQIRKLASATIKTFPARKLDGFGGFFSLDGQFKNPVLISSTDGVGTKLKVAFLTRKHDTIGEDLVNHCVNDILVHGAKPLFFLDYIALGKNSLRYVSEIVAGLSRGCRKAGCALVGGETAQMPDFYREKEYDLAGFIVGAVEKSKIIDGTKIKPGDQLLGLASNGLHTNGYSLARKVFFEKAKFRLNRRIPELGSTLQEELLKVHRSYYQAIHPLLSEFEIKGMAHITGGGIKGNLVRILPAGCQAVLDTDTWMVPSVFKLIQKLGKIEKGEMFKTFNMGIGMMVAVKKDDLRPLTIRLSRSGETVYRIGEIVRGKRKVMLKGL
ncbi:MAG: phosphoribosylformylglycinamidine cyclo-ligase [candidate division Zixibacteria bacterium RBG_16_50_21]|nr:MAG: phosphoribosylformylglycinamidine cyclo-ligase [candidate division Zixibacteria bacterium RBG_16_50_21]